MKKFILAPLALVAAMASHTSFAQSTSFEGWSVAAGLSTGGANTKISAPDGTGFVDLGKTNTVGVLDLAYGLALNKDVVLGLGATLDLGKSSAGNLGILGGSQDARLTAKNHYSVYAQPPHRSMLVARQQHK